MNAFEFIKKHGWEAVAQALKTAPENHDFQSTDLEPVLAKDGSIVGFDCKVHTVDFVEVKRLVESYELIEKDFESVEIAEYEHMISGCYSDPYWIRIKQAIADVESCQ